MSKHIVSTVTSVIIHCVCVHAGIPPSKRSEVWPLLTQRYQASNDPDWSLPSEVDRANGLTELLNEETEYENNIVLDLGKTPPPLLFTISVNKCFSLDQCVCVYYANLILIF